MAFDDVNLKYAKRRIHWDLLFKWKNTMSVCNSVASICLGTLPKRVAVAEECSVLPVPVLLPHSDKLSSSTYIHPPHLHLHHVYPFDQCLWPDELIVKRHHLLVCYSCITSDDFYFCAASLLFLQVGNGREGWRGENLAGGRVRAAGSTWMQSLVAGLLIFSAFLFFFFQVASLLPRRPGM